MRIITKATLQKFWIKHPDAETSLQVWYRIASLAKWQNFVELRQVISSASQVGQLTVFNIGGNKYRLICRVNYNRKKIYIRNILTHAIYDRGDWKSDPWFKE